MTYNSCWIERIFDTEAPATADAEPKQKKVLGFLTRIIGRGHYWVPILLDWAKKRNMQIDYVDNCWIRVPANYAQVREYIDEISADTEEQDVAAVLNGLSEDGQYVIVAEEY